MTDSADRAAELRRFLGQFETALRRESYLHFGRILPSAGAAGGGGVRGASDLVYDPVQPEPGETPDVTGGGEVTTTTQPASPATTIPPNPAGTITTTTAAGALLGDLEQQGPGDDAEDDPLFEPPPLYSTVSPGTALAHGLIVSSLRRIFPGLSEGVASDLVNQWAYRQAISQSVLPPFTRTLEDGTEAPLDSTWATRPGGGAEWLEAMQSGGPAKAWAWPNLTDALRDPWLLATASKIPTGAAMLPQVFRVRETDGRITLWDNTLASGPRPVGVGGGYYDPNNPGNTFQQPGDIQLSQQIPIGEDRPQYAGGGQRTWNPETEQWETAPAVEVGREQDTLTVPTGQAWGMTMGQILELPVYDRQMLDSFFATMSNPGGGSYGSGRTIRFDRDELIEAVNNSWQGWLLAKPADPGSLADQYIAAATSFYYQGGDLDFQTWVKNKMRETSRYLELYRQKPEYMTEDEYMGGYRQTAEQYGLRPLTTKTETEIGAQSGVSLTDFASRLAGTSEFMTSNQGQFSKAFASMLGGLGAIGRS